MMEDLKAIFTKEYIAKLERLSIGLTERLGAVGHSGSAKGSSLEFSDFREYIPGDDLRRVDWNGYGRFDKLYLKLFLEEKQAAVNLFLDTSKSMDFGGKIVMAKALAASLAYIAAGGGDRTQIFAFSEKTGAQKQGITKKGQLAETLDFLDGLFHYPVGFPFRTGSLGRCKTPSGEETGGVSSAHIDAGGN